MTWLRSALLALVLLLPALASAAVPRLAVTYFANNSGNAEFDPLGHGLADMLITDLAGVSTLQVVERTRLNEVLGELELQRSGFIDPSTAAAVGKGLGASYVLVGSFAAIEPEMRIDARIVDVATQEVVQGASVTGPSAEFFLLEKELATNVIEQLGVTVSARESARMGRVATESFEAFKAYSSGLAALDSGALESARKAMEEALAADDRFRLASTMLDDLRSKMAAALEARKDRLSELAASLLSAVQRLKESNGPWAELGELLMEAQTTLATGMHHEELNTIAVRILELELPEAITVGAYPGSPAVNDWALGSAANSAASLLRQADFLAYGQAYLERYPQGVYAFGIQSQMARLLESLEEQEANRSFRQAALDYGTSQADRLWCHDAADPKTKLHRCRTWFETASAAEVDADVDEDAREAYIRVAVNLGQTDELVPLRDAAKAKDPYSDETIALDRAVSNADRQRATLTKKLASLETNRGTDKLRARHFRDAIFELLDFSRVDEARALVAELLAAFPDEDTSYRTAMEFHLRVREAQKALDVVPQWEAMVARVGEDDGKVQPQLVQRARQALDEPEETPRQAYLLQYQATKLLQFKQFDEAGDRLVKLAETFPHYKYMDAASAWQMAATAYQQAWNRPGVLRAYAAILRDFPDSPEATTARTMMRFYGP